RDGQSDSPVCGGRWERHTRECPATLGHRARLPELDAGAVKKDIEAGSIVFADTRDQHEVHRGTVPGSINVPLFNKPATHAGWAYDPESDDLPLVVLADNRELAQMLWDHL